MAHLTAPLTKNVNLPKKARRAAGIFAGVSAVLALMCGSAALFYVPQWQLGAVTGVLAIYSLAAFAGLFAIRWGRINAGVWLLIGGIVVVFPVLSLLIAGFGLILGISALLLTVILATQILPVKQANWAVISGSLTALVTILIDTPDVTYRFYAPQLQPAALAIVAIGVILFVFAVARQFFSYSLRVKLIVAFLLVSLLSVAAVTSFSIWTARSALVAQAGSSSQNLARTQALNVGSLLARQLDSLRSLALNQILRERLMVVNANYGNIPTEVDARLEEMEARWEQNVAQGRGPLLNARLKNTIATMLLDFQQAFPENADLFVADKYGGLLATTSVVDDYDETDETWWQETFNNGAGKLYVSQPIEDEDSDTFGIIIGVPVYDNQGNFIGALRTKVDVAALVRLVTAADNLQAGTQTLLLFPTGEMLAPDGATLIPAPPDVVADAEILKQVPYAEFVIDGQPYLTSLATVQAITGEPIIDNLGWTVLSLHNRHLALAAVRDQQRSLTVLAALIALAVIGAATVMSNIVASPIVRLTEVARSIAGGDLASRAAAESADEVGVLATTFNSMADQLSLVIDSLEDRVAGRTQQLVTVVDVSQRLSGILDLSELMRQVVVLTKETFNYYHVHIYLVDERRENLIMAEGYGAAGVEMKRRGHSIPLAAPRSLVARAVRQEHIITVGNVREDPHWLPNALLPDTHSESAVPVMLTNEVVGALDVQSERVDGITADDEVVLQALANQIAIAVRNARLFAETQTALVQAQRLQQLYTGEAWRHFAAVKPTNYEVKQAELPPLAQTLTPEVSAVLQQRHTVGLNLAQTNGAPAAMPGSETSVLATPLKLRGQVIGVLGIRDAGPTRHWTADEIALIEAVSEQMTLAIENARLFDETRRQAEREKVIADITQQVWSSAEVEEVMRTAVAQLGDKLGASEVVIRLGTQADLLEA